MSSPSRQKRAAAAGKGAVIERSSPATRSTNKNPLGMCHRGFSFVKTDSPLAFFSVVAISQPHLAVEPKSIHGSFTSYHQLRLYAIAKQSRHPLYCINHDPTGLSRHRYDKRDSPPGYTRLGPKYALGHALD